MIFTLSPYLKKEIEKLASRRGCSQAEVITIALIKLIETEERQ